MMMMMIAIIIIIIIINITIVITMLTRKSSSSPDRCTFSASPEIRAVRGARGGPGSHRVPEMGGRDVSVPNQDVATGRRGGDQVREGRGGISGSNRHHGTVRRGGRGGRTWFDEAVVGRVADGSEGGGNVVGGGDFRSDRSFDNNVAGIVLVVVVMETGREAAGVQGGGAIVDEAGAEEGHEIVLPDLLRGAGGGGSARAGGGRYRDRGTRWWGWGASWGGSRARTDPD